MTESLRLESADTERYYATFALHVVKIAMALNIRNRTAEQIATTLTERRAGRDLCAELDEIARHCASLPVVDDREPDDILGYDEHGLPHSYTER